MDSFIPTPLRYSLVLLISALLVSGCSSSSDNADSVGSQTPSQIGVADEDGTGGNANEIDNATIGDTTSGSPDASTDGIDEPTSGTDTETVSEESSTTLVNFDITVPAVMSDALQVRLVWGDIDTEAIWNRDELWTVAVDFPVNTTNQLLVTFSDANGALTLGSFEVAFGIGENLSESFQIAADEFDTDRWDSDGDGVSNLSESIAGTNPQGNDALEAPQAILELVAVKTFRIIWQPSAGAQFYRVMENPDSVSGFADISGELDAATTSFDHRVALYARVNAEYLVQSCDAQGCVDSNLLMATGTLDNSIGYIQATNPTDQDSFGAAVSVSSDGSTLAIFGLSGLGTPEASRGVFVFVRDGNRWNMQAYITGSNSLINDFFGFSVSLSSDGNTLAVGAINEDIASTGINGNQSDQNGNFAANSGAVYVFVRSGEQWEQQAYVKASNTGTSDSFGRYVSLSEGGNTLAVGAPVERSAASGIDGDQTDNSARGAGAVYVFTRTDGFWQQQAYIKASNTESNDEFGFSLSLSADGNTLAVGAPREDSAVSGVNGDQNDNSLANSGAVYVFARNGEQWQQQAYVKASNTGTNDFFGSTVSLSVDGNTLAVGAPREDSAATGINGDQNNNSLLDSGAVYIFSRDSNLWQQQAYLKASTTDESDFFASTISLSADGNTLAVGALGEDSAATGVNGDQNNNSILGSGAVYTFVRNAGPWQQQAYLKASNTDEGNHPSTTSLSNRRNVSLSADGNTLAVGVTSALLVNDDPDDLSAGNAGAVYLY